MIKVLRDRTYLSVTVERMRDYFAKRVSNKSTFTLWAGR